MFVRCIVYKKYWFLFDCYVDFFMRESVFYNVNFLVVVLLKEYYDVN